MTTHKQVTDLQIERLALGELSPGEEAQVLAALEEEPGGLERLKALEASSEEILADYPPRVMAAAIEERARALSTPRRLAVPAWGALAASAAAALVAVGLYFGIAKGSEDGAAGVSSPGYVAIKGEHLKIFRKTPRGHEPLSEGQVAKSGDVLQIKYQSDGRSHGVIFSVDGRGATTLHFPESPGAPTALGTAGFEALGSAYELDDAPVFERFFFVVSTDPIDVRAVLEGADEMPTDPGATPELPENVDLLEDLVLRKPAI